MSSFKRGGTLGNSIFFNNIVESRTITGTWFVYFIWISKGTFLLSMSMMESTIEGFNFSKPILDNFRVLILWSIAWA